jgi:hypothetical protein
MGRIFLGWLIVASSLLLPQLSFDATQAPEGALKITTRTVAPGTGLSWGEGLLSYKGQDYPLTFEARGLFRNVDAEITAAELSGQVLNLKSPEDIAGNYQPVEAKEAESGTGSSATIKNEKGVVINLVSTVAGRKFNLALSGLNVELKKPRP